MSTIDLTVYSFNYNEEIMLPFFLKHYSSIAKKIVIYDNQSTDSSLQILKDWKDCEIEIREYDTNDKLDNQTLINIKNECWKNADTEYVVVCDLDEFLYHSNLNDYIKKNSDADIFNIQGYNMIGNEIPENNLEYLYNIIKCGVSDINFSKNIFFKKTNMIQSNYGPGAHSNNFKGHKRLIKTDDELKLLHYKWLSCQYVIDKHKMLKNRRSENDIRQAWGFHYENGEDIIKSGYNSLKNNCQQII